MKTLLLLRHAKSSWADPARADHDRELNRRGENAAPAMGRFLRDNGLVPNLIWCSTAARTVQTLGLLGRDFANQADVIYSEDLYMANEKTLLECLNQTHDEAESVMMIGHNPGFEDFAAELFGDGDGEALLEMNRKFPTCGLCHFEFDIDHWADVAPDTGRLVRFVKVKDLQAASAAVN
ncbi:histidine phosphatase family protein [Thalassospira alkalitolerans]|uniref:SixA phosphatase family protein n=1 Tax=Thalassospira alkalitolerans TaxID=1293890 RepID=UPI0030EDEC18|tara:strand:+ start:14927 stop:15463 length:537 start_codon:yes stop_codon:yes gene_type:complete